MGAIVIIQVVFFPQNDIFTDEDSQSKYKLETSSFLETSVNNRNSRPGNLLLYHYLPRLYHRNDFVQNDQLPIFLGAVHNLINIAESLQ